jgi:hypothetical protein
MCSIRIKTNKPTTLLLKCQTQISNKGTNIIIDAKKVT